MEYSSEKSYKSFIGKLIKYKLFIYICDGIIWCIGHSMPLIFGLILREFFNDINSTDTSFKNIEILIGVYIVTLITRIAIINIGARVDIYHKFQISSLLYKNIFLNICREKKNLNTEYSVGEMVESAYSDVDTLQGTVSLILDTLGNFVFASVAILILLSINIKLTLMIVFPIILVVLISKYSKNIIKELRNTNRVLSSKIAGFTSEMFESVQEVKINGAENNIVNHLNSLYKQRGKAFSKDILFTRLLKNLYSAAIDLGIGTTLIFMAVPLIDEKYNIGDFTIFLYYTYYIVDFAEYLGGLLSNFRQCNISIDRLHNIFNKVYKNDCSLADTNLVEKIHLENESIESFKVEKLTCNYGKECFSINDISFEIKQNTITAIVGKNGSGKSTVINAIMGYLDIDEGNIVINEVKNNYLDIKKYNAIYLPQTPKLINDTIKNNILIGIEGEEGLNKVLEDTDLLTDLKEISGGLDAQVGPMGSKLSGGQLQRVALARTFMRKNNFYIIDGIPNALDSDTERKVITKLYLKRDRTLLITTNNRLLLKKADNIIVLNNGKIECQGSFNEVMEKCKNFKKLIV